MIDQIESLNQIAEVLNEEGDVRAALQSALVRLIELVGLRTGWIFLADDNAQGQWFGRGFYLIAHHNLPDALRLDKADAWFGVCECQTLCKQGKLHKGYNPVQCSRLRDAMGEHEQLAVHASAPLRVAGRVLGILNVAAPDWSAFVPVTLALLTNVGQQMGIALERARLMEMQQEQRLREQSVLLAFSNELLGRPNLDDLMIHLVQEVRRLLNADASALVLPDPLTGALAFRAASGWRSDPVVAGRLVPGDRRSGPSLVMSTQQPFVAEDIETGKDGIHTPDWALGEEFHGHAVVPLIADGEAIGALMVDNRRPHQATAEEVRFLQLMANQAAIALSTARLHEEARRQERMQEELRMAQQIQLSLLPGDCPEVPGWDFGAGYRSARIVGGDFYDFFYLPGTPLRLGIVIADVADKGVPAALFMAMSRTVLRTTALGGRRPASALIRANSIMVSDSQANTFLTACYAAFELHSGRVILANAGHNRPLWWHAATGECSEIVTRGMLMAAFEEIVVDERELQLGLGDVILFYSDGITEAISPAGEPFGEERLTDLVIASARRGAGALVQSVLDSLDAFTAGAQPFDDVTLVVIRREPTPPLQEIPKDWSEATFPAQQIPAYVRRRAV